MDSTFFNIIGHEGITARFGRWLSTENLAHAYLFVGTEHVGRTTIALQIIRALLGHKGLFEAHPDAQIIRCEMNEKTGKTRSMISVEQIREVRSRLSSTAFGNNWRVVWIEEAERLSIGAANALLKILEEPGERTLFLLRAPHTESVVATIASRSQVIRFASVSREAIQRALIDRGTDIETARELALVSHGAPGIALSHLADRAAWQSQQKEDAELLGALASPIAKRFVLMEKSTNVRHTLNRLESFWRDALLSSLGCADLLIESHVRSQIETLARRVGAQGSLRALDRIRESRHALVEHVSSELVLEHAAL